MATEHAPRRRVVIFLGGALSAIAGGWYITWGVVVASATPRHNRPFWIAGTWLATAVFVFGVSMVTLGELGWQRGRSRRVLVQLAQRAWRRVSRRFRQPESPEPAPEPAPEWQFPLPYIDTQTGQMVLKMRHRETTNDRQRFPKWPVSVHVRGPGIQGEAVTEQHRDDRVTHTTVDIEFPRHFRNAPSGPIRPGRYEATWMSHPVVWNSELETFVSSEGGTFGSHSWTVYEGGRTWS